MLDLSDSVVIQYLDFTQQVSDIVEILDFFLDVWQIKFHLEPNISGQEKLVGDEDSF